MRRNYLATGDTSVIGMTLWQYCVNTADSIHVLALSLYILIIVSVFSFLYYIFFIYGISTSPFMLLNVATLPFLLLPFSYFHLENISILSSHK